jgi:ribonuclease-3 family protein
MNTANQNNNSMTEKEAGAVSAANLAYLGDCVYELLVREYLVRQGSLKPSVESLKYVTAPVQSGVIEKLLPHLTAEEEDAYKRGRNIGHSSIPKRSTVAQYRRATGLEALFGWLHLTGQQERLRELFDLAFAEEPVVTDENE